MGRTLCVMRTTQIVETNFIVKLMSILQNYAQNEDKTSKMFLRFHRETADEYRNVKTPVDVLVLIYLFTNHTETLLYRN